MEQKLKQSFGVTIRHLREKTGMAQENFAYEYGIARTYMGNIERGLANPSLDIIQTLANALQISVANLFTTNPQPSDTPMQTQNLRQNFGLRTRFCVNHSVYRKKFLRDAGVLTALI